MSEIKLRAFDKVNKEFVYVVVTQGVKVIYAVVKSGGILEPWYSFTGLKDKNGKEIYEGDILSSKISSEKILVVFESAAFCGRFEIAKNAKNTAYKITYLSAIKTEPELTVIGNIYENPELFK